MDLRVCSSELFDLSSIHKPVVRNYYDSIDLTTILAHDQYIS